MLATLNRLVVGHQRALDVSGCFLLAALLAGKVVRRPQCGRRNGRTRGRRSPNMTPPPAARPLPEPRIVIASTTSAGRAELAPWAREQLRDNVVPAEIRDQLVAEVRRWSSGRRPKAS